MTASLSAAEAEDSLLGALGRVRSVVHNASRVTVEQAGSELAADVTVTVQRPGRSRVRVKGGTTAGPMAAVDFEIDVSRTLEEFLVTAELSPADEPLVYASWTFSVVADD